MGEGASIREGQGQDEVRSWEAAVYGAEAMIGLHSAAFGMGRGKCFLVLLLRCTIMTMIRCIGTHSVCIEYKIFQSGRNTN